jgi:hypothetical protein
MRPMRPRLTILLALGAPLCLGACGTSHFSGVAQSPNPAPPPGYRVVCSTSPTLLLYVPTLLDPYRSNCEPVQAPVIERRVVVQAKG